MSKRLDPLGQSFFVDTPLFITKADLYFAEKDSNLPVFVQVRRNKNGAPSTEIVPFSQVVIPAANVTTSTNANVATTVTFSEPLYLDIGEYTLTIGSDSKNYRVYVSELDGVDTITSRRITEQPLLGTLFKSQNASNWTASQFEDLKLKLYRAVFNTSTTATVGFVVDNSYAVSQLEVDPLELYPNKTILKVYHFDHGLYENAYVKFLHIENANVAGNVGNLYGYAGNVLEGPYFQVSNVKLDSYTINLPYAPNVTTTTRFGGGVVVEKDVLYSTILPSVGTLEPSNTTASHKIITTTPSTSTYSIDSDYTLVNNQEENPFNTPRVVVGDANKVNKLSNAQSMLYRVEMSTSSNYVSPVIDTKQAGIVVKRNLVNNPTYATAVFGHEEVVLANANVSISATSNTTGIITITDSTDKSNVRATLKGTIITLDSNTTSTNDGQYRVVDILDSGGNVRVSKISGTVVDDTVGANLYLITNSPNYVTEEAAAGGSAYSKYITRQVDFVNPSTSIKFFVDVDAPEGSSLEFYYKSKLAGDTTNIKDIEYTKITGVTVPKSLSGEFNEVTHQIDNLSAFNSLIFKVVLLTTNEALVPRIKNLRIIALE